MSSSSVESWSLSRSLALLAATFALVFGALLPSAVGASTLHEPTIRLCSGDRVAVRLDVDGTPRPSDQMPADGVKCAACLAPGFTALPPPPAIQPATVPRGLSVRPAIAASSPPAARPRAGLRPPPTAPPMA